MLASWLQWWNWSKTPVTSIPGAWFNIKMSSYQYRKSNYGDKTVVRSSYLHNGISCAGKMTSLYWIRAQESTLTQDTFENVWHSNHVQLGLIVSTLQGAKPLSEQVLGYCHLDLRNKFQWNFNQNTKLFIHEYAFENVVCEKAGILSRGRWIKVIEICQ